MAYLVRKSDDTQIIIPDRTVDVSTSLNLIGKNIPNYGEKIAENFVHLLENFSSPSAPTNPIVGQLWWNNATNTLKVYTANTNIATGGTSTGWEPVNPPLTKIKSVDQNYTVSEDDHGKFIRVNSASSRTVTLPNTASIPVGTSITIGRGGAGGVVEILSGLGSVVEPSSVRKTIANPFGRVSIIKVSQDSTTATWEIDATAGGLTLPSWAVVPSATTINEGDIITWTVTTNVLSGTYNWSIAGSVSNADFVADATFSQAMTGQFTVSNGTATIRKKLALDNSTTTDNDTIILSITDVGGQPLATSATVTVNNTSFITTTAAPATTTTAAPTTTQAGGGGTTTQAPANYWVIQGGQCVMNATVAGPVTSYASLASCQAALASTTTTTTTAAPTTTTTTQAPADGGGGGDATDTGGASATDSSADTTDGGAAGAGGAAGTSAVDSSTTDGGAAGAGAGIDSNDSSTTDGGAAGAGGAAGTSAVDSSTTDGGAAGAGGAAGTSAADSSTTDGGAAGAGAGIDSNDSSTTDGGAAGAGGAAGTSAADSSTTDGGAAGAGGAAGTSAADSSTTDGGAAGAGAGVGTDASGTGGDDGY